MKSPNIFRPNNTGCECRGFTLMEVLVVTSIFSFLLGLGLLMSMDVFRGTTFRSTRQILLSALTTARGRALANMLQSPYGVCYQAPDFVIFRGKTYADGVTEDTIPGNPSVTVSGGYFNCTGPEAVGIVFSQVAATTTGGTLIVEEEGHPDASITVNSEGALIW
jgi:prepilin-type N-terminal cleavage/methylation domain-containing protein